MSQEINFSLSKYNYKELTQQILHYIMVFILIISGISKVIDPEPMIDTLKTFPILHEDLSLAIVLTLPIFEILLGLLLSVQYKLKLVYIITTILFLAFLIIAVYGSFIIELNNDCGCFGGIIKSEFGWGMVLRNFIFLCIALTALIIKIKNDTDTKKV